MSSTDAAVEMLMRVRQGGPRIAGLGDAAPQDEAGCWAIQREVLRRRGDTIGGYKCATPPGKPETAAIMAASGLKPAPARWAVPAGEKIGIETEIAFRFGRSLPGRATPYSQQEVLDAVAGCFPVIEMVISRYQDPTKVGILESMADAISHEGLVIGADVPNWRALDLKSLPVKQVCGGDVQVDKIGGNPSGDPLVPLVWLVNKLPSLGLQIEAGQVVTTGSCTGLIWVAGKQRVVGGFAGFGDVVVELD